MSRTLLLFLAVSRLAFADYGWIPEYQKLIAKVGLALQRSSENFDSDGERADIRVGNSAGSFSETRFFLETEYGIAEDWAFGFRGQIISGAVEGVNSGNTLASGTGIGDTLTWLKYNFKTDSPILTLETRIKFPTGSGSPATNQDLVVGDGNFDLGFLLHTGHRIGKVFLSFSPGFLTRFGNYSHAILYESSVRVNFPRGYLKIFSDGIFSLVEETLNDSSLKAHDAPGSGGTYARLSGSPTGINLGGIFGFRFYERWALELGASHGLYGVRYPNALNIFGTLRAEFDFFTPETKKRIREVPLDSDGNDKFYN